MPLAGAFGGRTVRGPPSARNLEAKMAVIASSGPTPAPGAPSVVDRGLKTGALGYVSNLVIAVASTAPAYSLAATLG